MCNKRIVALHTNDTIMGHILTSCRWGPGSPPLVAPL